jgi:hypothetical protein
MSSSGGQGYGQESDMTIFRVYASAHLFLLPPTPEKYTWTISDEVVRPVRYVRPHNDDSV